MTEQEAIKRLAPIVNNEAYTDSFSDACKMAIKALEKQIPKKPTIESQCDGNALIGKGGIALFVIIA